MGFLFQDKQMKHIKQYISESIDILNKSVEANETIENFKILCKYADLFNVIEQQFHDVNDKSTPTSRAIREETDKLFEVSRKFMLTTYGKTNFEYNSKMSDDESRHFDDDTLGKKKLSTLIRSTAEWKEFRKGFKKLKSAKLDSSNIDGSLIMLMRLYMIHAKDFIEDVEA